MIDPKGLSKYGILMKMEPVKFLVWCVWKL